MNFLGVICLQLILMCVGADCTEQESYASVNQFETVYGSKGVVSFINSDKNYGKNIMIFNSDGTVFSTISLKENHIKFGWYKVNLSGPDLGQALLAKRFHFSPYEFYPDYSIIRFAYKAVNLRRAEVYIDKEKKNTKFIKLDPTLFNVESWKTHLTGAIPGIDNLKNPLREKPNDLVSTKRINVPDDAIFRIINFKGYWTQVECFSFCESTCEKKYKGWIRWTNGKQPLLKLYYVC